jgi:phage gp36-like protein
VGSTTHEALVDYELMDLTLRGADRGEYTADEIAAADEAAARITDASTEADGVIDGFLARRYPLPLATVPGLVTAWARAITRYLLHKDRITDERSDPIARDYRDALKLLGLVADGKFSLGAEDPGVTSPTSDVRFESDAAVFGREQLRSFR